MRDKDLGWVNLMEMEIKIIGFGIIFLCLSCKERETLNKKIIGKWKLIEINCKGIDDTEGLSEREMAENIYIENLHLEIDPTSSYIFSMNFEIPVIDKDTEIVKTDTVHLQEHGEIINEKLQVIEWEPNNLKENENVTFSNFSSVKQLNGYNLTCQFGPLPMKKSFRSSFKVKNNHLSLYNDSRLSYFANGENDIQISTELLFKKIN